MVHRTYVGLGPPEAAVREFAALEPWVLTMLGLQAECAQLGPDHMAVGIALDGLRTAAFHFTRRPDFYHALSAPPGGGGPGNGRLADPAEAVAAFQALEPYNAALRRLQFRCRPFGRDYLALDIARQSLETCAFHFTREANFYRARADSAGPL